MVHHLLFNLILDHFDSQLRIHFFFTAQVTKTSDFSNRQNFLGKIVGNFLKFFSVYMCYSDETCTTTCPSSRRRREAQRALGIYRRETVDGVDFQDNGLPGLYFNVSQISYSHSNKPI